MVIAAFAALTRKPGADSPTLPCMSRDAVRKNAPWLIAGAMAAAMISGVAWAGLLNDGGEPRPAAARALPATAGMPPSRSVAAFPQFAGTPSAVAGRVTDTGAGISWAKLGKPWNLETLKSGGDFNNNLYVITDKFTFPGGKAANWTANVLSGVLRPDAKAHYTGPASLHAATTAFVGNVIMQKQYFPGSIRRNFVSRPIAISGHRAWMLGFTVSYHVPGVKATKDTDVAVLVDTGLGPPAVFAVSVPNDVNSLLPDITTELRSLRVSG